MKILLVNKFYFLKGGSERALFAQKELLESHGHDVAVFSMEDSRNEESAYSKYFVPNTSLGKLSGVLSAIGNIFSLKHYFLFKKLLEDFQPDVIHLHNVFFQISPSILVAARQAGIPVVATAHDYQWVSPDYRLLNGKTPHMWTQVKDFWKIVVNKTIKDNFLYSFFTVLAHVFMRMLNIPYGYIKAFSAPSGFMGKMLVENGYADILVSIAMNYVDQEEFKWHEEKSRDYILFVGRFSYEKGIQTLLQSLKNNPDIPAKIVGAGPLGPEVYPLIQSLPNVELIGFTKSKEKLKALYANARALVVPSEWYENNPLTILESFALGVPVIASNIGGLPELVVPGKTGLLVKAGSVKSLSQALRYAWSNPQIMNEMEPACIQFITDNCSADVAYKAMMDIYTKL